MAAHLFRPPPHAPRDTSVAVATTPTSESKTPRPNSRAYEGIESLLDAPQAHLDARPAMRPPSSQALLSRRVKSRRAFTAARDKPPDTFAAVLYRDHWSVGRRRRLADQARALRPPRASSRPQKPGHREAAVDHYPGTIGPRGKFAENEPAASSTRLRFDMADDRQAPEVIMFVRHGEKPGEGSKPHGVNHLGEHDEHSLSVLGWTRAGALAGLFAHAPSKAHPHVVRPGRIIATRPTEEAKSKREIHTASPTAKRLKLAVEDSHTHGNEESLVSGGARPDQNQCWSSGITARWRKSCATFQSLIRDDIPKHWPDERFDLIWVLVRQPGAERWLPLCLRAADAAGR